MGSAQLGYPDEQDEAGLRVVGVLVALIYAVVEFILHSFRNGYFEKYVCITVS